MASNTCPCGRNKPFSACCEMVHQNIHLAKTAEDLMRSRYTAFTTANVKYLGQSHYSKTLKIKDLAHIEQWTKTVNWMKLEVLDTYKGTENDDIGRVEFKAFYLENGRVQVIHENSLFCKENNHWVYETAL